MALGKQTHQQTAFSVRVKRRKALVSIENVLTQSAVVTAESTSPSPPVGVQFVVLEGDKRRSQKSPAECVAIAGTKMSKKRLRRL